MRKCERRVQLAVALIRVGSGAQLEWENFCRFFVASDFDKEKFVHYISFEEWQRLISDVIQNAVL